MLRHIFYFGLLTLALVVAVISLDYLRSLHHSILFSLLFIPVWSSLVVIFASVARFKLARTPSGNGR